MTNGNYVKAAKICRSTPGTTLRNIETINMFKSLQGNPIQIYFQTILETEKLNSVESIEMSKPLVEQGRSDLLNKWFKENKFTCSEELSELVKIVDPELSLNILIASGSASAYGKVIEAFCSPSQLDKIFPD